MTVGPTEGGASGGGGSRDDEPGGDAGGWGDAERRRRMDGLRRQLALLRRDTGAWQARLEPASYVAMPVIAVPSRASSPAPEPGGARPHGGTVALTTPVTYGGTDRATLTLVLPAGRGTTGRQNQRLRDAADEVGLLMRTGRLHAEELTWKARLARADDQLARSRAALATLRSQERERLVTALVEETHAPLAALQRAAERLRLEPTPPTAEAFAAVSAGVDLVLERLRSIGRGTSPSTLREFGPTAALAEFSLDLHHHAAFPGDTSVRAGWEIESALFWAVSAVLTAVDRWSAAGPGTLRVRSWRGDGLLRTVVEVDRTGSDTAAQHEALLSALVPQRRRLEIVGGGLSLEIEGTTTVVAVWLPDSLR